MITWHANRVINTKMYINNMIYCKYTYENVRIFYIWKTCILIRLTAFWKKLVTVSPFVSFELIFENINSQTRSRNGEI